MINNNPYIVPEKPLKQSKVTMESYPLFPHQVNRRTEEMEFKQHPQMLKRSTLPIFFESSVKEVSRIPLSPQTVIKTQPLQVSTVTHWQSNRQTANNLHLRELNERINAISDRLESQERRLSMVMDVKKQEHSTSLSDSTAHTYEPGNLFVSKQMERYSQFEASCQNSTEIVEKLREEVNSFKFERERYELNFKEHFNMEMQQQKQSITEQLINNFRQSLNEKFIQEGLKINETIQEIARMEDAKIENAMYQIRKQISNQIYFLKQQLKSFEGRQKNQGISMDVKEKFEKIYASITEVRAEHLAFKDHVFKSILSTHHMQEQMAKMKEKLNLLSSTLQKKQVPLYEGYINVSSEKTYNQILKLSFQSYMTVSSRFENAKAKVNESSYYIDTEGYLLDADGYYILNSKNVKIKIEENEMRRLRDMGILQ